MAVIEFWTNECTKITVDTEKQTAPVVESVSVAQSKSLGVMPGHLSCVMVIKEDIEPLPDTKI